MADDEHDPVPQDDERDDRFKSVEIKHIDPRDLVLLKKNARFMKQDEYQRLVANVRRDGMLTSVPLARLLDDGRYEVVSGNHRTMAAIDVGLETIAVMCIDDPMELDRVLATQLAHNAIVGEDDPAVLKELYDAIEDVDWRDATGLDDATLNLMESVEPVSISPASLKFTSITLMFLPAEGDEVRAAFEQARDLLSADETWLVSMADYDDTMNALTAVAGSHGIKNQALALRLLVRLATDNYDQLNGAWWDENNGVPKRATWVPLASVLGVDNVPPDAAGVIRQALDHMVSTGAVSPKAIWQGIELLAADYLAGS